MSLPLAAALSRLSSQTGPRHIGLARNHGTYPTIAKAIKSQANPSYRDTGEHQIAPGNMRLCISTGVGDPGRNEVGYYKTSMTTWDDTLYLKFGDKRTRAARELLSRVPLTQPTEVVDLGSGPGNSTALLRERWPAAHIVGVDNSQAMLARARRDMPNVDWVEADVRWWRPPAKVDVLFANAVFQWLPDHTTLFAELIERLRPGGTLALQMPHNLNERSHRLMREIPGPWSGRIEQLPVRTTVLSPSEYYDSLARHARNIDIWQTTYEHVMPDARAITEWVKGTGLRPYLEALTDDSERSQYLNVYTEAIDAAYPPRADGKRLFSFPRLFVVAVR